MTTILVCGGRDYTDGQRVSEELNALKPTRVVAGDARGADELGLDWARLMQIENCCYHADWNGHGRAAGPLRNQQMLDAEPVDIVLAFPGGRGTADMVRRAKKCGVRVIEVAQ